MRTKTKAAIAVLALAATAIAQTQTGHAGPTECGYAVNQYNSALSELEDALRRYARCVSDSRGHDDCSSEFSRLRSAQDDFESAVSSYEMECS